MNTGELKELSELATVGKKRAQLILSYRTLRGEFKSFTDLYDIPSFKKRYIDSFLTGNLVQL